MTDPAASRPAVSAPTTNGAAVSHGGVLSRAKHWARAQRQSVEWNATERQQLAFLLAVGFVTLLFMVAMAYLPMPYVRLSPGRALDTLGKVGNKDLISITGHRSYPTKSRLFLTSVSIEGGPYGNLSPISGPLSAWLERDLVVPTERLFPPNLNSSTLDAANKADMLASQDAAEGAALVHLGLAKTQVSIAGIAVPGATDIPVKPKDIIKSVDAKPIATIDDLDAILGSRKAGDTIVLGVERSGKPENLTLTLRPGTKSARPVMGIYIEVRTVQQPTTKVTYALQDIGGPSAGLMFALAIVDKLTPGDLAGKATIAGTGTISVDGQVGDIGGIEEKFLGARSAGARYFLAPSANCSSDVVVPDGLEVFQVATLSEAITAAEAIGKGDTSALRPCRT